MFRLPRQLLCFVFLLHASCTSARRTLPRYPQCGYSSYDRLIGRQIAAIEEFPWSALIGYSKPNGTTGYNCGGSLINSRYVLTAAHCIDAIPRGWKVIGVRLGEHDINNDAYDCSDEICAELPVDTDIERVIVHENYDPLSKGQYNDIALIRMSRDVSYTSEIYPICLPTDSASRSSKIAGTRGVAAGWGRTETASATSIKHKVDLDVVDTDHCSAIYNRLYNITLRDTQLCTAGVRSGDICSADSGGSLMKRIKSYYVQYGIVSFGPDKCGTKDRPGVYTNVAKYIDWIENQLE